MGKLSGLGEKLDNKTLGGRIKKARKKAGITQEVLAKKLGMAYPTMNKYENNKRVPRSDVLAEIAVITKCDPGWLLLGDRLDTLDEKDLTMTVIISTLAYDLPEAQFSVLRLLKDWKRSKKGG